MKKKKKWKALLIVFLPLAALGAAALLFLRYSKSTPADNFRQYAKEVIAAVALPKRPELTGDMRVVSERFFVNGEEHAYAPRDIGRLDVKQILRGEDFDRFGDYASGYALDLPSGTRFDLSKSASFVEASGDGFKAVISREWSYDDDVSAYIAHYYNRFNLNEAFQAGNGIRLLKNETGGTLETLSLRLNDYGRAYDTYTYLSFKTSTPWFYRVMLKYDSEKTDGAALERRVTDSFRFFRSEGEAVNRLDYAPIPPDTWNRETRALYESIAGADTVRWGILSGGVPGTELNPSVTAAETALDHRFDTVLMYVDLAGRFPSELMQKCYDEGRLVEMTMQFTYSGNWDLFTASPALSLYREGDHAMIREFARAAKAFGHPFLFRLCNEMNSDWTSYGGVNNLCDPDIFVENWRTVYRIFEEEGVDNAIWIFNPNSRDFPPAAWNSFLAYYPGDRYVQMIGLTAYNTGTYYAQTYGEYWRSFTDLYDEAAGYYAGVFDRFPWIITEFASSSHGGDKPKWIRDMFARIGDYPNIKIAVWYNADDYNPDIPGEVARPYRMDETPESLEAFRTGLARYLEGR